MIVRRLGLAVLLVGLAGAAGCSGEPKLVPVTGTVTVNGKTFKGMRVYFVPKDPSVIKNYASRQGFGITDDAGRFEVEGAHGKGLATGEYKLTFSLFKAGGKAIGPNQKPDEYGAKESLPAEFTDPGKSQTFRTVSESDHDFKLEISFK